MASAFLQNIHKKNNVVQTNNLSVTLQNPLRSHLFALPTTSPALEENLQNAFHNVENSNFLLSSIASDPEPLQTFEPVVDIPALASFSLVFIVFTFLQLRSNAIAKAAERRDEALKELRMVKSKQLSYASDSNNPRAESVEETEKVNAATEKYRLALEKEANLRYVLPGVRIAAPNRPDMNDENVAAAKLFLGVDLLADYDMDSDLDSDSKNLDSERSTQNTNNNLFVSNDDNDSAQKK